MTEQELKVVLQGVLDGKELQFLYPDGTWFNISWETWQDLLVILNTYGQDYPFRIKPEVKTLKYWTRPCMYHEVLLNTDTFNVWCSNQGVTQENYARNTEFSKDFRWLAPATEHHVAYE